MFEQSIEWLRKAGLINIVFNLVTPKLPLSAYCEYSKFIVYMHDVGLLAAKLDISSKQIVLPDALFKEFNGAFIENFIAQELKSLGYEPIYYWTSRSQAEVDFIIKANDNIYPLEVKSGTNKSMKSLRSYADKYEPEKVFRFSPRNLVESGDFINIPLYATKLLYKRLQTESRKNETKTP